MTRYFAQNTPRAGLEHMMMSVPGFQKRGGGMMILSRFCYKPEDVDCRYCLHYRRRSCQVRTCPYIAERLKSGAIEYLDLILEYFGHIPHAGLHKRIQAVEHWSGPDQAVLHTVSVHLRSRFADRVWDDAPPGYLAALYLLASKERLWQPALPALSHDSIDFSRIVSKPHGFAIQDYPIFYSARRLYDLKSPMEAEDLAHPKLVSDLDFHNIIYATMIARYGKAVMDASTRASRPKTRRRQECTGQTGYTMHILDGIVTEVLHQVFDKMQGASNDMIVGSAVQKQMAMIRSELQRARAENTKANKEYESLKAEVLKAIQGKSALPQDVLTEMLEDTRQKVLSTSERITTLTAELNDGNSKIEEMKAEFNRIVSWSKIFDESPMEVKKMICGYIIKKVSVFRDYRIKIEFNINVEQFLNGIDSIDECDTYELPMAQ